MKTFNYLILGSGVAAGAAVQELVDQQAGTIAIITADTSIPYDRPPLSKGFLAGEKTAEEILIQPGSYYRQHGIEVLTDRRVTNVDFDRKKLACAAGEEFGYNKLLLAPGSEVRRLSVPGAELEGRDAIFYLRSLADARKIRGRLARGGPSVVIGSGFIGMEVASVFARLGHPTTMVFPEDRVWKSFFTPEMSAWFQRYYEQRGVRFVSGHAVTGFRGDSHLTGVLLASGRILPAEFVVVGIGVQPATELFQDTPLGLAHQRILVNEYLETNLPNVWAAGDAVSYPDAIFGRRRHIEHWDNAIAQGRHAAGNMAGARAPFVHVPYFFSDVFDLSYEFWGDTSGHDQAIHRGDIESASFSTWWLQDGRLLAAFVLNRPNEERELAPQWIREHRRVDPGLLRDSTRALRLLQAA